MGWFDEQIRQRIQKDDELFSNAFAKAAGVVMGEKITLAWQDDGGRAKKAVDDILRYYHVSPQELPENITDFDEQLEYLLRPSGLMRRTVKLEGAWYKDAVGPMLGALKDGGVVALLPRGVSGYFFVDPKSGKKIGIHAKTAALLDSEAICFYQSFPLKKLGVRDMLLYIVRIMDVSDFVAVGALTLVVTLIGMLIPKINNIIYAHVVTGGDTQLLFAVFSFLLCVTLSQMLMNVVKSLVTGRLSTKMDISFHAAGMMRMLSLPASFYKEFSAGDLATRMGYIASLCHMLANAFLMTGLTSVFSLAYISQMVAYGPGLVLPGLLVILVTTILSVMTTLLQIKVSRRHMEADAKESGLAYAMLTGVQKIKLAGAEKRAFAKWADAYADSAKYVYDPPALLKFSSVFATCASMAGTIVIYYFTIKTHVSLADYFAFNAAYGMVMGAFASLIGMATTFAQIKPILHMIKPILNAVPEVDGNKKVVTKLQGGIELNNITFRYTPDMPPVIDDLSLKIRPGQYVAVVGETGCGKSTLTRLMLGFEKPQKGAVYYDGKDISNLDLKSLRRHIGVVMQNGKLFQGDIFSNITISAPRLSLDEAWEAAEAAGVAEDIRQMPMGMHTVISEGSGGISGGQRQRLMIARAIAPKPKILIFDEATSALDNLTQKTVSDSLDRLKCTRIVVAHRLSTIRQCDRIIVLSGGKIAEDGTYDELIARDGLFTELVARQRLDT